MMRFLSVLIVDRAVPMERPSMGGICSCLRAGRVCCPATVRFVALGDFASAVDTDFAGNAGSLAGRETRG